MENEMRLFLIALICCFAAAPGMATDKSDCQKFAAVLEVAGHASRTHYEAYARMSEVFSINSATMSDDEKQALSAVAASSSEILAELKALSEVIEDATYVMRKCAR
jgi:uncharacterized OsmC-like protein